MPQVSVPAYGLRVSLAGYRLRVSFCRVQAEGSRGRDFLRLVFAEDPETREVGARERVGVLYPSSAYGLQYRSLLLVHLPYPDLANLGRGCSSLAPPLTTWKLTLYLAAGP